MARVDADLLRSLAETRAETLSLVSCYCDLDPGTIPTEHELASHVTSLVGELANAGREAAESAGRISTFLQRDLDRTGAHGLALFAAGKDGPVDVRLQGSVPDAVHVGRTFVVGPLLEFLERDRPVVVAAVDRDRGTLWQLRSGGIRELDDLSRDGQGRHDQGGWSQARYQRARAEEATRHLREVAERLDDLVPEGSETLLVVACMQDQRSAFEELLAPHVQEALIGWVEVEKQDDAGALAPAAETLLSARLRGERESLLERWREARGQRSGQATGQWAETIAAAWDGRIETLLVDGRTESAFECPQCGRGYGEPGACALDGTSLVDALGGGLELAVRGTLLHGGEVRVAASDELDADSAGAVALLRYAVTASRG